MALKVYRIDNSLVGKVFRLFRKSDLPTMAGAAMLNNVGMALADIQFPNHYVIDDQDELKRFVNPLGNSWIAKEQYYIRHPKEKRDRWLIEAESFHEFIYREQISEIISFLRSNLPIRHINIKVEKGIEFGAYANIPIEEMQIEGKAELKFKSKKEITLDCKPLKISEKRSDYVWINDFQELREVVDDFEEGEFKHTIIRNNSFKMSVKEANTIGVSVDWLQDSLFEISFRV